MSCRSHNWRRLRCSISISLSLFRGSLQFSGTAEEAYACIFGMSCVQGLELTCRVLLALPCHHLEGGLVDHTMAEKCRTHTTSHCRTHEHVDRWFLSPINYWVRFIWRALEVGVPTTCGVSFGVLGSNICDREVYSSDAFWSFRILLSWCGGLFSIGFAWGWKGLHRYVLTLKCALWFQNNCRYWTCH